MPEQYRKLALDLEDAERETDFRGDVPKDKKAKIYTCLAHDWYDIEMEEEGNRLLLKAEKVFPGYFKELVIQHMLEDAAFEYLVKRITLDLIRMMTGQLKEKVT